MSKVLFIRGLNESLREKLDTTARREGLSTTSIIEEAIEGWLDKAKEIPTKHHLVLYSEKESLMNFIKKMDKLTSEHWNRFCIGNKDNKEIIFLKKNQWENIAILPYTQLLKNSESYSKRVFDKLVKKKKNERTICIGFMTGDIANCLSLKQAVDVETISNIKRKSGVMICPYNIKDISNSNMKDLLNLIEGHDKVFLLQKNKITELNHSDTKFSKLLI